MIKEHPIQHIVAYTHDNTLMLLLPYLSIMIKNTQWSKIRKKMQFKVVSMFTSKTKQKILKARWFLPFNVIFATTLIALFFFHFLSLCEILVPKKFVNILCYRDVHCICAKVGATLLWKKKNVIMKYSQIVYKIFFKNNYHYQA